MTFSSLKRKVQSSSGQTAVGFLDLCILLRITVLAESSWLHKVKKMFGINFYSSSKTINSGNSLLTALNRNLNLRFTQHSKIKLMLGLSNHSKLSLRFKQNNYLQRNSLQTLSCARSTNRHLLRKPSFLITQGDKGKKEKIKIDQMTFMKTMKTKKEI